MKSLIPYFILMCFATSISLGAWDHTISDTYEYGTLTLTNETLLVTGAGANRVIAKGSTSQGSSYVEMWDTDPLQELSGGIWGLIIEDKSTLNLHGGDIGGLSIYDDATATLEGGRIDYINSYQRPLAGDYPPSYWDKHIEIICKAYDYNTSTKLLTGTWADDSAFSIQLVDQSGYYSAITNIEFTIIPEPATLSLLGLGGLLLRRKLK